MIARSVCRSCGSQLTHLRGATGRVSVCPRCGWGKVELTGSESSLTPGAALVHLSMAHQDEVVGTQWSR